MKKTTQAPFAVTSLGQLLINTREQLGCAGSERTQEAEAAGGGGVFEGVALTAAEARMLGKRLDDALAEAAASIAARRQRRLRARARSRARSGS